MAKPTLEHGASNVCTTSRRRMLHKEIGLILITWTCTLAVQLSRRPLSAGIHTSQFSGTLNTTGVGENSTRRSSAVTDEPTGEGRRFVEPLGDRGSGMSVEREHSRLFNSLRNVTDDVRSVFPLTENVQKVSQRKIRAANIGSNRGVPAGSNGKRSGRATSLIKQTISSHKRDKRWTLADNFDAVVVDVGDIALWVCESNMLCRGRCEHLYSNTDSFSDMWSRPDVGVAMTTSAWHNGLPDEEHSTEDSVSTQPGLPHDRSTSTQPGLPPDRWISTQPGSTSTQPGWTSTQPGLTSTQPGLTSTQPGLTSTQSGLTSTQPGLTSTQPGLTSTQPGLTSTQPGLTSTQPGLTSTQPGLTSTQPGLTSTQPSLTSTQPGSTSTQPGLPHDRWIRDTSNAEEPKNREYDGLNEKLRKRQKLDSDWTSVNDSRINSHMITGRRLNNKHGHRTRRDIIDSKSELANCAEQLQVPVCHCDETCVMYGDCCPDVFRSCFLLNDTEDLIAFISRVRSHSASTDRGGSSQLMTDIDVQTFISDQASCESVSAFRTMLVVGRCPADYPDSSIKHKCNTSSLNEVPPVTVTFPGGDVTFRNAFCAQCHGVEDTSMKAWSAKFFCRIDPMKAINQSFTLPDLTELVRLGTCDKSFAPPTDMCPPRQCDPVSSLSSHQQLQLTERTDSGECSLADALLCQAYYYPNNGYKNVHCGRCLHSVSRPRRAATTALACDVDFHNQHKGDTSSDISGGILIILDITGTYSQGHSTTTTYVCEDVQVFDPLTQECKVLICPPGFQPYRGRCQESTKAQFIEGYSQIFHDGWNRLFLRLVSGEKKSLYCEVFITFLNSSILMVENLQTDTLIEPGRRGPDMHLSNLPTNCHNMRTDHADLFTEGLNSFLLRPDEYEQDALDQLTVLGHKMAALSSVNGSYELVVSNLGNLTQPQFMCSDGSTHKLRQQFRLVINDTIYVLVNTTNQDVYYPFRNIGFEVSLGYFPGQADNLTLSQTLFVCGFNWVAFNRNCSVVKYWLNETLLQNGSQLMVLASHQLYQEGEFQIRGEEVFVCTSFEFQVRTGNVQQSLTYIVLSCIATILSSIFLLVMLLLYCLFPELRTLPGKMTASLAVSMMLTFVSNMLTLFDLHHDYACPVAAALSHLVTLAHFGWMSAIAVNMALTFSPLANTMVRVLGDRTVFIRYSIVVWGVSLVLVMTSVILDLTHPDLEVSDYPRYGYPFCTWFSGPLWTKLAFVIIPYAITFIISLIGFILTLVGIQQASKRSQRLGKTSPERACCMIYIKLSSAMGFSWAISMLINIYPSAPVLPYIVLSLVLVQGVLLFMAFMFNHRVYSLVLKKFKAVPGRSSKSGSTKSSVVT